MADEIELASWERAERARNVPPTDSAAPAAYSPLHADSAVFTHLGHAAQYGGGRRYGIEVRCGIFHTTESDNFDGSMHYDARRPETVSATAHAGKDGELGYGVPFDDRPWTTGRWNDESETLEICGRAAYTAAQWRARPNQIEAIVRWTVDVAQRRGIPANWLTPGQFAVGASRVGQPLKAGTVRGFIDHRGANDAAIALGHDPAKYAHWDVGQGMRIVLFEDVLPEARRRLGTNPTPPPAHDIIWTDGGTMLHTATPKQRIADTRTGLGVRAGIVSPGSTLRVPIPKVNGVQGTTAIVNVTITEATAAGFGQVDGDLFNPDASDLNFTPGAPPHPAATIADIGVDGAIGVTLARGGAHVIVDLLGVVA